MTSRCFFFFFFFVRVQIAASSAPSGNDAFHGAGVEGDERSALHAVYRESTCSSAAIFQAEQQGQISASDGERGLRGRTRGLKGDREENVCLKLQQIVDKSVARLAEKESTVVIISLSFQMHFLVLASETAPHVTVDWKFFC